MRKSTLVGGLAAALASMVLVLPPPASAQMGGGGGGGSGDIYADLFVVLRDADGVPMLSGTYYEEGPVEVTCVQPISYTPIPGIPSTTNPADGRNVYLVPLQGVGSTAATPVAADTACLPQTAFSTYASEVDLERLNLVRTSDAVLWKKLADVGARLAGAAKITLDGAGRITTDGVAIDASPDQAAIYAAEEGPAPAPPLPTDGRPGAAQPGGLMDTGTIPHWLPDATDPVTPLGDPAKIVQGSGAFDNWMLAAAALGTATSKGVPITIDTVQYYNRTAAPDGLVADWDYASGFILPQQANGEKFIDYRNFMSATSGYTRSDVFTGCTTWLDVPTLRWKYDYVINRVEFTDIVAGASTGAVRNIAGFAQLADDVRSVINYIHENGVVVNPTTGEGFFVDPVFTESCDAQAAMVDKLNTAVDPSPPTVTITSAPDAVTTATDARFEFTANADAASVLCVLDGGPIELCISPKTYTGLTPGEHTFTVIAGSTAGNYVSDTHTWRIIRPGEDTMITPLNPVRLADTRPGWVAADGLFFGTGPVAAGQIVQVSVANRGGVPADAKAAVLNVTIADPVADGYATVFPCGTVPYTSSSNYSAGENVANEVIAKLSPTGTICVFTYATANVIVDVAGYVPAGSDYVGFTPVRVADTRTGWVAGDGLFTGTGPVPGGQFVQVPVAGRAGVPADAKAVVANVTIADPVADGYATVFPCGTVPFTSSSNYSAGENVANEVIAKLSPTGTICVFTYATANVIVDVAGYVPAGSDYVGFTPVRVADTRTGWVAGDGLFTGTGPVPGGQFVQVPVAGRAGVPADAKAVVANVTIADPVADGYATVFPCGTVPFTSSSNYSAGENVANEVIAKLSPTGTICVFTYATANVIVDVAGYL